MNTEMGDHFKKTDTSRIDNLGLAMILYFRYIVSDNENKETINKFESKRNANI